MRYIILAIVFFLYNVMPINTLNEQRIANGKNASGIFLFACNIFVVNLVGPRIGGGTIITSRHVLTTASLVAGTGNSYRIDYRQRGDIDYRHIVAYIAAVHIDFNPTTLENDIALVFLSQSANRFPFDNIVKIGDRSSIPTGTSFSVTIVGHGLTSPNSTEISRYPYYANYTTDGNQNSCNRPASSHLCLYGGNHGVLCPGDVGSGIFSYVRDIPTLLGIVVNLPNSLCTFNGLALYSAYTAVGYYDEWIQTITGIAY